MVGGHSVLLNLHAEEIAFQKIQYYIKKNNFKYSYNKNIYIYIFKSKLDCIKEVYCCKWCIGLINRHKFPKTNIITMMDNKVISAINYTYKFIKPLKKKK